MELLSAATKDRPLSYEEMCSAMRELFPGVDRRLDRFRVGGGKPRYLVLATVYPTRYVYDGGIVPHELSGEPAKLLWWQKDNHLVGLGLAASLAEATDQALHGARRGHLERMQITVWFDRIEHRFRFFRRDEGARYGSEFQYRPRGDEISRDVLSLGRPANC